MSTVYIGTLDGGGLVVAEADPVTGALTATGALPQLREPSALAFAADRRTLYAVSELPGGLVTAVDVSDPRRPAVRSARPSGGAGPTHLAVHGGHLVTAHYTDGTVAAHPLAADGSIGPRSGLLRHHGAAPRAHQVVTDPSGRWLLAVDLGADAVLTHRLVGGGLVQHAALALPVGTGPRHLAFHPDGRRVFVLGELRPELTCATWDAATGALTAGAVVRVAGPGAPDPTHPAEVLVSPDGRTVYASTRGEDSIAVLRVRADGVSLVQTISTGGRWPRHCALSPTGTWLYAANQHTGSVTWLPRDPVTGELGPVAGSVTVRGAAVLAFA